MRQTIELLCMLEPINVDIAIETVAMELESAIFDVNFTTNTYFFHNSLLIIGKNSTANSDY